MRARRAVCAAGQALAESTGRKDTLIKKEYEKHGDLGVVAVQSRSSQRTIFQTKPLTIRGVFQVRRRVVCAHDTLMARLPRCTWM